METYIISIFMIIAFSYLLWENVQLRKLIKHQKETYKTAIKTICRLQDEIKTYNVNDESK